MKILSLVLRHGCLGVSFLLCRHLHLSAFALLYTAVKWHFIAQGVKFNYYCRYFHNNNNNNNNNNKRKHVQQELKQHVFQHN